MHYMHYKDYIHHGLAAEKTPPPLPQGGGNHRAGGGGGWGDPCSYIRIGIIYALNISTYLDMLQFLLCGFMNLSQTTRRHRGDLWQF